MWWCLRALLVLIAAWRSCSSVNARSFEAGDLIFVDPPMDTSSAFARAIEATGEATLSWWRSRGVSIGPRRNVTSIHVGMFDEDGNIIEAVPYEGVHIVKGGINAFTRSYSNDTRFYVARVFSEDGGLGRRAVREARRQIGAPYAQRFEAPPHRFYCSSLIEYAYQRASGRDDVFNPTFTLIFEPRSFWVAYYARMNETVPPKNTTGSNPTLLLHSPSLRVISDFAV